MCRLDRELTRQLRVIWVEDLMRLYVDAFRDGARLQLGRRYDNAYLDMGRGATRQLAVNAGAFDRSWLRHHLGELERVIRNKVARAIQRNAATVDWYLTFIDRHLQDAPSAPVDTLRGIINRVRHNNGFTGDVPREWADEAVQHLREALSRMARSSDFRNKIFPLNDFVGRVIDTGQQFENFINALDVWVTAIVNLAHSGSARPAGIVADANLHALRDARETWRTVSDIQREERGGHAAIPSWTREHQAVVRRMPRHRIISRLVAQVRIEVERIHTDRSEDINNPSYRNFYRERYERIGR